LGKKTVWLGMLSYDKGVGLMKSSLVPTHHISSTLNHEEDFLARSLGISSPRYLQLSKAEKGVISTGDVYVWNGKALVIDL
jgi:hypothetical protein